MMNESIESRELPDSSEQQFPTRTTVRPGGAALRGIGMGSFNPRPAIPPKHLTNPRIDESWKEEANCDTLKNDELFFPEGNTPDQEADAMKLCRTCKVNAECLEFALEAKLSYGIWGGVNADNRRKLQKRKLEADQGLKKTLGLDS